MKRFVFGHFRFIFPFDRSINFVNKRERRTKNSFFNYKYTATNKLLLKRRLKLINLIELFSKKKNTKFLNIQISKFKNRNCKCLSINYFLLVRIRNKKKLMLVKYKAEKKTILAK